MRHWLNRRIDRRRFLKASGGTAAGLAVAGCTVTAEEQQGTAQQEAPKATLPYPRTAIARASELTVDEPVTFNYPDEQSPCALLKTGRPVDGGVGPEGDIVAYSTLCSHMGMPLTYDAEARTFKCFEHFSIFDPELRGQQVCGHATDDLPRIQLAYDESSDELSAIGVAGLIYGRASNIL
ncbi:MAG: arsenate reductase (azurin) small subunit [Halorhodospira sp.]